jgi:hypothetical protein
MQRRLLARILLFTVTVVACTTNSGGNRISSPSAPNNTPTPSTPSAITPATTPPAMAPASLTVSTQSATNPLIHGIQCPQWLVLTREGGAYTSAEMGQMKDYLAHSVTSLAGTPPPTLTKASVATIDPQRPENSPALYWNDPTCTLSMQITNTGKDTIQITQIGLELTSPSRPNAQQYHLIEACTLTGASGYCGVQRGGGPPQCSYYTLKVRLSSGATGADYLGTPVSTQDDGSACPVITLASGSTVEAEMDVTSLEPLIYPVEPLLIVRRSGQSGKVPIASASGFMTFASPAQFDCYAAHGQSLTVQWSGPDALAWHALAQQGFFCA